MGAFTTKAAGNWNSGGQTTWNEVGVPGDGDVVTLNHAVAVTANATIGINGTSANHLIIQNSGSLTIAPGVKLTVRGYIYVDNASALTVSDGSTLEMNSTAGSRLHLNANGSRLVLNGTSGNRATISKGGSGEAWITGGSTQGGIQASYANFTGMRDSNNDGYGFYNKATAANNGFSINRCIFDSCGPFFLAAASDGNFAFTNNTHKNSPYAYNFTAPSSTLQAATTGSRVFTGNVLDKFFNFGAARMEGFTISGNVYKERILLGHGAMTDFSENLVYVSKSAYPSFGYLLDAKSSGTHQNNYFLANSDFDNPHFVNYGDFTENISTLWNGNVFEARHPSDATGDCVLSNPTAQRSFTLSVVAKNNLVLPTPAGYSSGTIVNAAKFCKGVTISAENNTYNVGGSLGQDARGACIERGIVNGFGGQNILTTFRNNLAWDSVPGRGYKAVFIPDTDDGSVETGTATGGSATTLTASKSWAVNIFNQTGGAGTYYCRLTSGVNSGSVGTITGNSSGSLTVSSWSAGSPANGDTFKIFCVDPVSPANVAKNAGWNVATGERYDATGVKVGTGQGNGYHQYVGSVAIGSDDVSIDPKFVDLSRNSTGFDASLGGPGTVANLITEISKMNDQSGYNSAYNIQSLLSWVKAGFAPKQAALKNGYGGTFIGAIAPMSTKKGEGQFRKGSIHRCIAS